MGIIVYRWQDENGRGPYKPGFSHVWTDPDHNIRNPSIMEEFGMKLWSRIPNEYKHRGCAFQSLDQMNKWFSAEEQEKLRNHNYTLVTIDADRIIAMSKRQCVIACRKPFIEKVA